jgi:hypothetical protein
VHGFCSQVKCGHQIETIGQPVGSPLARSTGLASPVDQGRGDEENFDKPLLDRNGNRIEWFTRVETPGDNAQSASNDVQWVKATVSPHNPSVFSFEQVVVEPNLMSYAP